MHCFKWNSQFGVLSSAMEGNNNNNNHNRSPTTIVPAEEVMARRQVLDERWRMSSLFPILHARHETLKWLARRHLICNQMTCSRCAKPMSFSVQSKSIDGFGWRCRSCSTAKSIRGGSFFSRSHLNLEQVVLIVYLWCWEIKQQQIAHEAGVAITGHTIIAWCNFCRQECDAWLLKHPNQIGGIDEHGQPTIVEIGETQYFHKKYCRGTYREGHWVFGGVERKSGKCFLVEVPDRSADTLLPTLCRFLLPGTHVMSDGWPAYEGIEGLDGGVYLHSVVVHKEHIADPDETAVHTQNSDNMWLKAKRKLKKKPITYDLFPSYLREFEFRNFFKGDMFSSFLFILADNYDL